MWRDRQQVGYQEKRIQETKAWTTKRNVTYLTSACWDHSCFVRLNRETYLVLLEHKPKQFEDGCKKKIRGLALLQRQTRVKIVYFHPLCTWDLRLLYIAMRTLSRGAMREAKRRWRLHMYVWLNWLPKAAQTFEVRKRPKPENRTR